MAAFCFWEKCGSWDGYRECHILPEWLLIYTTLNAFLQYKKRTHRSDGPC